MGMIEAGMKMTRVAVAGGVSLRSLEYWWSAYKRTGSVSKKKRTGRPKILGRVEKMIISKSLGKKCQSRRKLSKRMKAKNPQGSKDTANHFLLKDLGMKPFHRRKISRLTEKACQGQVGFP